MHIFMPVITVISFTLPPATPDNVLEEGLWTAAETDPLLL